MTAEPPADDPTDAGVTGDESSETAADAAPETRTQSEEPPATETDSPVPDDEFESESDDLEARLERLRPPQPSQAELEEPVSPAETLRPAAAQEGSDDANPDEKAGAHHGTPSTAADAADQSGEREQRAEEAALDELQPVATELRTATERTASDSQRCAPVAEDAVGQTRGSDDAENETDEGGTEEV